MRKIIKKVLMCEPLYFSSLNYVINPWMKPGTINGEKAMNEWKKLVAVYKKLGIKVEIIKQEMGSPDMVFATDQGIVKDKKVLLSRFQTAERTEESKYYEKWFKKNNYEIIYLPEGLYFEGNGDSFFWSYVLFVGTGYRSNRKTCRFLESVYGKETVPLYITDPAFYHLDVGFFPLDDTTAFYYPPAFSEDAKKILQYFVPNLIEFSKDEAFGFAANSVVTGDTVVTQKGNTTFRNKLEELKYKVIEVDVSEFMKSGGGIHCLTNVLEEETIN